MKKCRVCQGILIERPLFELKNMPAAAQFFPDESNINEDVPVDLVLRECSCCGVVQLDCSPVPYWREVVRASAYSEEMKIFRLKQFSRWIDDYHLKGKRVLEAGCGCGEYLSLMKECGADAFGVEYGRKSVETAQKAGLQVERAVFETGKEILKGGKADAFYVLNWLEHLPDIPSFFKAVHQNTTQNAVGLVEVPNASVIFEKGQVFEITRDHLYYFTKETFLKTLSDNGFDVLSIETVWYDYILSAVIRKRLPADMSKLELSMQKIKSDLKHFTDAYETVAFWGAGPQALAVLAANAKNDKIVYVVDSAPFKQNKMTPATHIKIVSPEYFWRHPPQAVVVAAAAYSSEVVDLLKKRFNNSFDIAVLTQTGLECVFEKNKA